MWDRQYLASLAATLVFGSLSLGVLVAILAWAGWKGVLGLLAIAGGLLVWFYWGPRPDLRPSEKKPAGSADGR